MSRLDREQAITVDLRVRGHRERRRRAGLDGVDRDAEGLGDRAAAGTRPTPLARLRAPPRYTITRSRAPVRPTNRWVAAAQELQVQRAPAARAACPVAWAVVARAKAARTQSTSPSTSWGVL